MADESNALGVEGEPWDPDKRSEPIPADDDVADFEPVAPALLEWTPERAGAVVRAAGFGLHMADNLSNEPEGVELWRATEADVAAMGPPLARILNRYEPARRLAGVVDEGELGFAMAAYARRNLALRGRVATARKGRADQAELDAGNAWPAQEAPPEA